MLRYKGYTTILQLDPDACVWHGRVMNIQDVVTFEGKTQKEAEKEFCRSIDAYLSFCQNIKRLPNQPPFRSKPDSVNAAVESWRGQDDNFDFSNIH
jgi:predicted HicB family RNase H-like nuclease